MSNNKVHHLLRLVALCNTIQQRLLSRGRSKQYDYVIINIFNLVTEYPDISIRQLVNAYYQLMSSTYDKSYTSIYINTRHSFLAKSLY